VGCSPADIQQPIAVFDSGVGGISVLAHLIRRMPQESYVYFGDSAHAPYGNRTPEEVRSLTEMHIERLVQAGAKAAVIACNTATGAAISSLRQKFTNIPIVGIEPALKPAVLAHPGGRILVLATPVTLASAKFRELMNRFTEQADILPVPCERLAQMVESGVEDGCELDAYLREELAPWVAEPADALVLGCTHYPFVRRAIIRAAGTEAVYDGGEGTARETENRLKQCGMRNESSEKGTVRFLNSMEGTAQIQLCERLLARALSEK